MQMTSPYAKYALIIDLILLSTCALLLLIDLKIKDALITEARKLEEKLDEQRRPESNGNLHPVVSGNLLDSDVPVYTSVEATGNAKPATGARRPRKGNTSRANGSAGNTDSGIPGPSNTVGS